MNAEAFSDVTIFMALWNHERVGWWGVRPTNPRIQAVGTTIDTSSPGGTTGTHGFFFCANQ